MANYTDSYISPLTEFSTAFGLCELHRSGNRTRAICADRNFFFTAIHQENPWPCLKTSSLPSVAKPPAKRASNRWKIAVSSQSRSRQPTKIFSSAATQRRIILQFFKTAEETCSFTAIQTQRSP